MPHTRFGVIGCVLGIRCSLSLSKNPQREAAESNAKVESERLARVALEMLSVRALAATGQTPEAIAALLSLPLDRVSEILHASESNAQSKE